MILDAVYNCDKTLFVIGGEQGTSQVRYDSLMQAFTNNDLLKQVKLKSDEKTDKFVSMDDFINNYRHLIADCFIFCPINGQILDFTTKCFNKNKKVYMQGQNKLDFNVKMSYSCENQSEIVINNIVNSINKSIIPIDSLVSGTPINVSDIIPHPFITIAKKTALAKALGLGGIKKILTGFFICNDVSGLTLYSDIHKSNGYDKGLTFQTIIINKFGLPDIKNNKNELIGSKGNTSIPILNIIYGSDYGKNIFKMLGISDDTNLNSNTNSEFNINTFISEVFDKNDTLTPNINKLLNTVQGNNQSLHITVKIIIVIIFGYIYSICGNNLNEVFDDAGNIKEFNRIDVTKLTTIDVTKLTTIDVTKLTKEKEEQINKMFANLQLWDYVGFLAFNSKNEDINKNADITKAFESSDLHNLKRTVAEKLNRLMKQIPAGTSFGGKRTKRNKITNKQKNKIYSRKHRKSGRKTYRRN